MTQAIKLAFASGPVDRNADYTKKFAELRPDLPLYVIGEFPPPAGRWIPYHLERSASDNLALFRDELRGKRVELAAVFLGPHLRLRLLALAIAPPHRLLVFNESLDHIPLHPRALPAWARHFAWRAGSYVRWQLRPGGDVYTWLWRLRHPHALRRPWWHARARAAGFVAGVVKRFSSPSALEEGTAGLQGVSVVIPSRNGRELLGRLLPGLLRELEWSPAEVIVSDNGSDDGTGEWLAHDFPNVRVIVHTEPLSFAKAVNTGIRVARFSHTLLLNNDMVVEPGFVAALQGAFARMPYLFCATAQIFFPEGVRREETGKTVLRLPSSDAFPVYCVEPLAGEDGTWVPYGSGGCSLYATAKLRALGSVGEVYEPAYVEDLDLGYRAWLRGWPTVFVAGARVVHEHRATTSRYYSDAELERVLEVNWLRFVARSVADAGVFRRWWQASVDRLNLLAVNGREPALSALGEARHASGWLERPLAGGMGDEAVLALGAGDVAVFPGRAATGKPRVLVASAYIPFPLSHGGAVRMYNLMRLAADEFDQVLITFVDDLHTLPRELLDICCEVVEVRRRGSHRRRRSERPDVVEEFASAAFEAALRESCRKWSPAIVQLEFTHMAQYASACRPAKTVLVEHDITLDLYEQLLREQGESWELRRQHERWSRFEHAAWAEVDCVVTMSRKDKRAVTGARRVEMVENGVDLERFRPADTPPEPGRMLFIGSFAHLPNVLGLGWFLREVWPRLTGANPTLHVIAGKNYARHMGDLDLSLAGLEVEDFVADPRGAYARASMVIAPLLASAGTNIKIMEAMAMGKAIVSTSGGVNGLDVLPGRDVIVVADAVQMAEEIAALLRDPARAQALGAEARKSAARRYGWPRMAAEQSRVYRSLIASSRR